jgi:phosphotransferase system enzyme I (PtsP)
MPSKTKRRKLDNDAVCRTPAQPPGVIGLSTLEDITQVILHSEGVDETLQNIVHLVAGRMHTEVCSVYLLDEGTLTLRASEGLSSQSIGNTHLKVGEGLVGLTAESGSVINLSDPEQHPKFRYVAGSNEERLHSFLGIPLYERSTLLGVMAIQTISAREFSEREVSTLRTIAFQLSSVIANAKLLESIHRTAAHSDLIQTSSKLRKDPFLVGTGLGNGVCSASAFLYQSLTSDATSDEDGSNVHDEQKEWHKLVSAIEKSKIETLCLQKAVTDRLSDREGEIFQSHLMILQDRQFLHRLEAQINLGNSANQSVKQVIEDYQSAFEKITDPYIRARSKDIEDVGRRIQAALTGRKDDTPIFTKPVIIVANDLLPSQLALLPYEQVAGLVLESEQSNSHAAIIAKSMGIPTLCGARNATRLIKTDDSLIVDANSQRVYINPDVAITNEYERLITEQSNEAIYLDSYRDRDGQTSDGHAITLRANVGLLSDIAYATKTRSQGVGLYRTEFPFMTRTDFPTRTEQFSLYRQIVESFPNDPVTFRTLDIGGDKALPYFPFPNENNPFLGWRSIRVTLDHPTIFQTQIEAILMASRFGEVRVMFPMVTTVEELDSCLEILDRARASLAEENITYGKVDVGVMVEAPGTISIANHLAAKVDFFSLGTNDLIQYLLAADRGNRSVRKYYCPYHPAVFQSIQTMVTIAQKANRPLCVCGEMASDFYTLAILVGMGVDEFSLAAPIINRMKRYLSCYSYSQLREITQQVLTLPTSSQIEAFARRKMNCH